MAQSPIAMTTRGSGTALRVLSSGWCMLRVTTPLTVSPSACRGEATRRAPKRSASYTDEKAPVSSISQPLQEPQSTCRSCSEPATPAGGSTVSPGGSAAGSTMRPARRILPIQLMGPAPWSCGKTGETRCSAVCLHPVVAVGLQVLQKVHLVGEQSRQHLAGQREQVCHVLGGHGVDDVVPLLAGHDHAGPAQDGQLLGKVRGLQPELGHQLADGVVLLGKQLQNPDSCGVPKGLEELCLELVDRFWHGVLPFCSWRLVPDGTIG